MPQVWAQTVRPITFQVAALRHCTRLQQIQQQPNRQHEQTFAAVAFQLPAQRSHNWAGNTQLGEVHVVVCQKRTGTCCTQRHLVLTCSSLSEKPSPSVRCLAAGVTDATQPRSRLATSCNGNCAWYTARAPADISCSPSRVADDCHSASGITTWVQVQSWQQHKGVQHQQHALPCPWLCYCITLQAQHSLYTSRLMLQHEHSH